MNGARSTFMRKGYWLTALAAIVLLAASAGTAQAQVTVTAPAGGRGREVATIYGDRQGVYPPRDTAGTTVTADSDGSLLIQQVTDPAATEGVLSWNDVSHEPRPQVTLTFPGTRMTATT